MRRPVLAVIGLLALAACGGQPSATPATPVSSGSTGSSVSSVSPTTGTVAPATTTTTPSPTTTTTVPPAKPAPVVVLDPGHNGANAANPGEINRQVPAGRGRVKACNTTGTATDDGYPEHTFAWDVAVRTRDLLTEQGVRVVLTRPDDDGVGPCVDRRAAIGNEARAAAVVSIHADGASASAHGFHIAYSAPPLNEAQGEPSMRLATTMRDTMVAEGFAVSTYIGTAGLSPRDDLGGLNLSQRPAVLVECGNMRNATEAAKFSSPAGRASYAAAIAAGVLAYLG